MGNRDNKDNRKHVSCSRDGGIGNQWRHSSYWKQQEQRETAELVLEWLRANGQQKDLAYQRFGAISAAVSSDDLSRSSGQKDEQELQPLTQVHLRRR